MYITNALTSAAYQYMVSIAISTSRATCVSENSRCREFKAQNLRQGRLLVSGGSMLEVMINRMWSQLGYPSIEKSYSM